MANRFVVCLSNEGFEAALEPRKIYPTLRDSEAEREGLLRVVDESGEDYLYPAEMFEPVILSKRAGVFLLELLGRGSAAPYAARPVPADDVREQRERYGELLGELGSATHGEILTAVEERELVSPESGLTLETVERIRARRGRREVG